MRTLNLFIVISLSVFAISCGKKTKTNQSPEKSNKVENKTPKVENKKIKPKTKVSESVTKIVPISIKTGEDSAMAVGGVGNFVLFFAGDYISKGSPFKKLLAVDNTWKVKWSYKTDGSMGIKVVLSKGLVILKNGSKGTVFLNSQNGKPVKAAKVNKKSEKPFDFSGKECKFNASKLNCTFGTNKPYTIDTPSVKKLRYFEKHVCFTGEKRSIKCFEKDSGKVVYNVAVPAVPGVKNPESINFSYVIHKDALFVAQYNGTILIYKK
jgi:hypothetical protein